VLGAGPVGLSVVLALRAAGRGPVLVSELAAVRRTAAERLGADIVVNPAERSPFGLWDMLGVSDGVPSPLLAGGVGRAPPVTVFECTGTPGMLQQILDGVPIGSRIVVVGACVDADAIVPATGVVKELELVFSFAYRPGELVDVLHDIAGGALDVSPLVTGTVGLAGVAGALDALARDPSHIKIVVRPEL
jgi:threonine dehydrogenase-like Zn-dependent dehydrogenase